jgi:hypothetical protein
MGTHENTDSGKRGRATTLNHFKIDRRNSDKIAIRHMVKEKISLAAGRFSHDQRTVSSAPPKTILGVDCW